MSKADLSNNLTKDVLASTEKDTTEKDAKRALMMRRRVRMITYTLTLILAGFVCYLSVVRYFTWMVQTVIYRTDVHISEVPFPAVTLCPMFNIKKAYNNQTEKVNPEVNKFLRSLEEELSIDERAEFNDQGLTALNYIGEPDVLEALSFRCEDFFAECTWRRIKRDCCNLFRTLSYNKRICYAFNSLSVEEPDPTWPWSETLSGRKSGLRIILNTNASEFMMSKVMAMIHYPEEAASTNTVYIEGEVHITLDALKFYADNNIRQLGAAYRHCYFSDEIKKYRKSASQCYEDCRIAYIERVCECTPRSRIKMSSSKEKTSCNSSHLPCLIKHRGVFFSTGNIYESNLNDETVEFVDCKCYPNCNYVQYKTFIRFETATPSLENNSMVDLEIQYLRDTIFSYRTGMVYNLLDLVVAICSIIALFLGISFISVIKSIQNHFAKRRIARALGKAEQKK